MVLRVLDNLRVKINHGSRFRQNFIKAASANFFAQGIAFVSTVVLTRLYLPADFAAFGTFVVILDFWMSLATLRFEWWLPNCATDDEAGNVAVLAALSLSTTCLIFLAAVWFGIVDGLGIKGWQYVSSHSWILPIYIIGYGLQMILQVWFVRTAQPGAVSRAKVWQSSSSILASILLGVLLRDVRGLIIAQTIGQWAAVFTMIRGTRLDLQAAIRSVNFRSLRESIGKFGHHALVSSASSMVSILGISAPTLLIAQHYHETELGWYALVHRLITAPASLIANSLGQSFWAEAAILVHKDMPALKSLYLRTTKRLALLATILTVFLLAGPWYVGLLFGTKYWAGAGYVVAALTPMFVGVLVVSPLNHLIVHGKQHWQLYADVFRLVCISVAFLFAVHFKVNFLSFVLIIAVISFLSYLLLFGLHIVVLNKKS